MYYHNNITLLKPHFVKIECIYECNRNILEENKMCLIKGGGGVYPVGFDWIVIIST